MPVVVATLDSIRTADPAVTNLFGEDPPWGLLVSLGEAILIAEAYSNSVATAKATIDLT